MRVLSTGIGLVAIATLLGAAAANDEVDAASPDPSSGVANSGVGFVDGSTLEVTLTPKENEPLKGVSVVAVQNSTPHELPVEFTVVVTDAGGAKVDLDPPTADDLMVAGNAVEQITLTFPGAPAEPELTGFLVLKANGQAPSTRPIHLSIPADAAAPVPLMIILSALATALAAFIGGLLFLPTGKKFFYRMGPAEFKGGESWASTIAGAGGLVGAIGAGTGFLPEETHLMTTGEFAGLALLFAAIPVIAAFFYATVTTTVKNDKVFQEQGFVGTFLIAGALTTGAVVGQLTTLAALVADASTGDVARSVVNSFYLVLALAGLLSFAYGVIQMRRKVNAAELPAARRGPRTSVATQDARPEDIPGVNGEVRNSWSLL